MQYVIRYSFLLYLYVLPSSSLKRATVPRATPARPQARAIEKYFTGEIMDSCKIMTGLGCPNDTVDLAYG